MFVNFIRKTMEVYVDDMLVGSLKTADHVEHLDATFHILRKYGMRLNLWYSSWEILRLHSQLMRHRVEP